jgi:hypothetical protein
MLYNGGWFQLPCCYLCLPFDVELLCSLLFTILYKRLVQSSPPLQDRRFANSSMRIYSCKQDCTCVAGLQAMYTGLLRWIPTP